MKTIQEKYEAKTKANATYKIEGKNSSTYHSLQYVRYLETQIEILEKENADLKKSVEFWSDQAMVFEELLEQMQKGMEET